MVPAWPGWVDIEVISATNTSRAYGHRSWRACSHWYHTVLAGRDNGNLSAPFTATDNHPVWVDNQATCVDVRDLQPGDLLLAPDGMQGAERLRTRGEQIPDVYGVSDGTVIR